MQDVVAAPQLNIEMLEANHDRWATDELTTHVPKTIIDFFNSNFNLTDDLNWKSAIVEIDSEPRYLCFICHHIVADLAGLVRLGDEVSELLSGADTVELTEPRLQPGALARLERSGAGIERNQRSLTHWRAILNEMSTPTLKGGVRTNYGSDDRRVVHGVLKTNLQLELVDNIASRFRTRASILILALMIIKLPSLLNPISSIPVMVQSSNRFTPSLQTMVGTVAQGVPILIEVPDRKLEFVSFVRKLQRAVFEACRNGSYDCVAVDEEKMAIEDRRGVSVNVPYSFNSQINPRINRPRSSADASRLSDEFLRLPSVEALDVPRRCNTVPRLDLAVRSDGYLNMFVGEEIDMGNEVGRSVSMAIRKDLDVLATVTDPNISVAELG